MGWVPQFCRSEGGWLLIGQTAATWPPPAPASRAAIRSPCKQASGPPALSAIGGHSGWGKGSTQSCPEGVLSERGGLRGRDTSSRNGLAGDGRAHFSPRTEQKAPRGVLRAQDTACGQPASRGGPPPCSPAPCGPGSHMLRAVHCSGSQPAPCRPVPCLSPSITVPLPQHQAAAGRHPALPARGRPPGHAVRLGLQGAGE